MTRYVFALIMAMIYCIDLQAQDTCHLSAQIAVVEYHNSAPIADIMLYISEQKTTVQTDENGMAMLNNICQGIYHVHLHSNEIIDTTILLRIEKSGLYTLKVPHANFLLHQVIINKKKEQKLIQDNAVLGTLMMQKNSGKTLSEQLKNINGISTLSNGATISKPIIHGLHSNRILILNNGIRQEDQQWGSEHAPNIDPFVAHTVSVLKGAAGVRYGTDAIGGVLLVEPNPIRVASGWSGEINLGAFSNNRMGVASGMLEQRFSKHPKFSFRVQGSLKQGGNYQLPGGIWVANSGIHEHNFSTTLAYRNVHSGAEVFFSQFNNVLGIYSGSHTGSQQDLYQAINSPIPLVSSNFSYQINRPKQVVTHDLLKIKSYLENKLGVWNLVYAFQHNYRQEYDIVRVDNGKAQLNLTLNTQTLNLNLDHKKFKNISGQVGIDGMYQHNTFKNGDRVFIPSYYALGFAAYAIERYTKGKWALETGLRFDYKHFEMYNPEGVQLNNVQYLFDYKNPSATLAFKNTISKRLEWSATLANAWRPPQAPELFSAGLHQGGGRIEFGNRNLQPESSLGLTLAGKYEVENKAHIELSLYAQSIQNFIYLKPGADTLTIKGYYKTFNYTQTKALMSGADVAVNYTWNKHWSSHIQASILRAKDVTQNDWLILMPSDRFSAETKYEFVISKHLKDCYVGINTQYVLQQKRIPSHFDQIDYPRPPSAYFLMGAEAGLQVKFSKQALFCSITATNLLNQKYRDYLDVFRYFLDQPGRNIAFRVRIPFN